MASWDNEFDIKPKGTDLVGEIDDYVRATRQEVRARLAKEHLFDMTNPTTQGHQGLARQGSARVWFSDTEPASPLPSSTEADNDATSGRLWVVTSSDVPTGEIKVYDGSAWVSLPGTVLGTDWVTALGVALGTGWTTALAAAVGAGGRTLLGLASTGADSTLDADLLDGLHKTSFVRSDTIVPGSYILWELPSQPNLPSSLGKVASYKVQQGGTYRIGMGLSASAGTSYGRIYVNGSAVGTQRSTTSSASYVENIAVAIGDIVQIYGYNTESEGNGALSSFTLQSNNYGYTIP